MKYESEKKKKLILLAAAALSIILPTILFVGLFIIDNKDGDQPTTNQSNVSGEPTDDTPTGPPEPIDSGAIILGSTALTDRGLRAEQRTNFISLYKLYIESTNPDTKQVSIDKDSVKNEPFTQGQPSAMTFRTVSDTGAETFVRLTYPLDLSIRVELKDKSGKLLLDTGFIQQSQGLID